MEAPAGASTHRDQQLWGIGWYPSADGPQPYEATPVEMVRHEDGARVQLQRFGVVHDDILLFTGRASEAVQFAPWEQAANQLGAAYTVVDGYRSDAQRLLAYLGQFSPRAVLGLVDELVAGLSDQANVAEVLATVPVVAARPLARARLAEHGVDALLWLHAGPAVAVECLARAGAHVDVRWAPAIDNGELVVHGQPDQLLSARIATGLPARLLTTPCDCGSVDPRIVLDMVPDWAD
jgi:hypothetical protein